MPPKEELLRPFDNVFECWLERKKVVLEWEVKGRDFYFRPYGVPVELLWFASNALTYFPPEVQFARFVSRDYKASNFCRLIPLENLARAYTDIWVVAHPNKYGVMCSGTGGEANWPTKFEWSGDDATFLSAHLDFFYQSIIRSIENDPDEWQKTIEWARLDSEQRFWFLVSWKQSNVDEWKILVEAALQIYLYGANMPSWSWCIFYLARPRFSFAPLQWDTNDSDHIPTSALQMLQLLQQHVGAQVDYSLLRFFIGPLFSPAGTMRIPVIHSMHPSHHELMGALDLWREFGRKSGQLAEVESCLWQLLT